MVKIKQPVTYDEQIAILESRGCIIQDEHQCKTVLSRINYYRFSAYFLPFKQDNEKYAEGTTFEKIYHIYEFDRQLRNILYDALETIEITLRTRLAYFHAMEYGALGYLNPDSFNKQHQNDIFKNNIDREIQNNRKVLFVKHHLDKYEGNFPIWVITELFTFGMLSYFYSDLKTKDQKTVAKEYQANYRYMRSWLRCCTDIRNICAHYGRLYYRIFPAIPAGLDIPESGKRRLWGAMLVIKALYPSKNTWDDEIVLRLEKLFKMYAEEIELYHIAFPENWFDILSK